MIIVSGRLCDGLLSNCRIPGNQFYCCLLLDVSSWTIACFFCVCSIIVGSITPVHTANIAFMSGYGEGSHFMVQAIVGDELARRGHNVTGLISQAYEYKLKTPMYASFSSKLNFKSYDHATSVHDIRNVYHQLTDWVIEGKFLKNVIMEFLFTLKIPTNVLIEDCNFLLGNETFMNMFRSLELDLVIADSYYPCTVLLAEAVEAQYVSFCPTNLNPHFAHVQGTTLLPSIYPSGEFQFSQRMNFYQRFCNSLSYLKEKFFIRFLLWLYNPLRKKYQLNPQLTTREALSRSSLWLYDSDFYIDFPAPMLPNTVMVGGITTRPSKPLPPSRPEVIVPVRPFVHGRENAAILLRIPPLLPVFEAEAPTSSQTNRKPCLKFYHCCLRCLRETSRPRQNGPFKLSLSRRPNGPFRSGLNYKQNDPFKPSPSCRPNGPFRIRQPQTERESQFQHPRSVSIQERASPSADTSVASGPARRDSLTSELSPDPDFFSDDNHEVSGSDEDDDPPLFGTDLTRESFDKAVEVVRRQLGFEDVQQPTEDQGRKSKLSLNRPTPDKRPLMPVDVECEDRLKAASTSRKWTPFPRKQTSEFRVDEREWNACFRTPPIPTGAVDHLRNAGAMDAKGRYRSAPSKKSEKALSGMDKAARAGMKFSSALLLVAEVLMKSFRQDVSRRDTGAVVNILGPLSRLIFDQFARIAVRSVQERRDLLLESLSWPTQDIKRRFLDLPLEGKDIFGGRFDEHLQVEVKRRKDLKKADFRLPAAFSRRRSPDFRRSSRPSQPRSSGSSDRRRASPKRCRSCKQFLAEWDAHDLCVRCRSCSTKSRCSICRQWSVEWAWLAPKKKAGRKRPDNSSEPTGELSGKKVSEAHSGANPSSPAPSSGKKSSGSSSKRSRRSRATTSKTTNPLASSPATTSQPSTTSVTTNPPAPLSSSAESTNPPGSQRTAAIVGTNTPGALPSSASNPPESQQTASIIGVNTPGALPAPTTNPPESQQTAAIVGVNTPGALPTTSIEDSSISPETHSNVPFVIVNPPGALSGTALMGHNLPGALVNTPGALVNTPGALVNTPGSLLTSLLLTSNTPASLPGIASSEVNTPEALSIGTLTAPNPPGPVPATAVDSSRGSSVTSRPGVSLSLVSSLPATVSHTQPCDVSMLSGPSSQNDPSATLREIFLSSDSPSLGNRDFEGFQPMQTHSSSVGHRSRSRSRSKRSHKGRRRHHRHGSSSRSSSSSSSPSPRRGKRSRQEPEANTQILSQIVNLLSNLPQLMANRNQNLAQNLPSTSSEQFVDPNPTPSDAHSEASFSDSEQLPSQPDEITHREDPQFSDEGAMSEGDDQPLFGTDIPKEVFDKADILEFADSAGEDGFIIFSLGTYVINLKQDMNVLLAEAFSRLPQKVFWQLNTAVPANLPENVMAMKWLPQNDLLGHPNAKLLLYQSGVNGLYEALYHGVPIIAIPFAWDQPDVASRIVGRKIGLALDFWSMTPEKIVSSITTVINDTSYKENIMKLSAAWRDQKQHPKERAADSIEQVIKHGGEIMRFYGSELNFAQYYLLDVTAFCIFLCYLFLRLLLCLVRCHTWVYYRFSIPKSKLKGC
ncbi:UDP-glucuronosyltransferase 2B23 [Holothuria leucospilota]|uniref:UDP-glucuronosyltransferase 2B23 n=1 Tax=Holothuria leucospilota TaxID=206669 RepID=A0A9Q1C887_HOLLE|nr:UDP-glucuronosyltransferase 2B23 [Holothuria leucospilota]